MSRQSDRPIIIFRVLGPITALMAIVFAKVIGKDVRYLRLSPRLAQDSIATRLKVMGIKALSYEDVDSGFAKYCRLLAMWSTLLYREHIRNEALELAIAEDLKLNVTARERFSLACEHYLQSELEEPVELLLFCQEFAVQCSGVRITVISQIDEPLRLLFKRAAGNENWRLLGLPSIPLLDHAKQLFVRYIRLVGRVHVASRSGAAPMPPVSQPAYDQQVIYWLCSRSLWLSMASHGQGQPLSGFQTKG